MSDQNGFSTRTFKQRSWGVTLESNKVILMCGLKSFVWTPSLMKKGKARLLRLFIIKLQNLGNNKLVRKTCLVSSKL